ncbi:MAG: sulfotransferase family 2 domain-containing protein [Flavobacteriaceae bacterium]|nr:sulfotransferase family 2 domain-containing protein [Flavobacteriaceae bacterium]
MLISHRHKYVFVQLPRTGSTTIGRELRSVYDGHEILYKHCSYSEFLKVANEEEKQYFAFSCIRNPLDDAVSRYFKLKTNFRGRYTDPQKLRRRRENLIERIEDKLFRYIQENDANFEDFFLRFYVIPYNDWSSVDHKDLDFVIRFENLQEDFSKVLKLIGLEQERPLPVRNKTPDRERTYLSYYTPRTIKRAKRIFGPYMQQWGYEMPADWGDSTIPWWNRTEFQFFTLCRKIYWKYFRDLAYPESVRGRIAVKKE